MAYARRDTDAEGVVLAVKIILSVIGIMVIEALVFTHDGPWPGWLDGWLNWWSGPAIWLGLIWGGFWFFMWLWEVVTDAD